MHKFSPENADRLENIERYTLIPPKETLLRFGLSKGMTFVDVGAGTGFFSRAAAEIVGNKGHVYSFDMSDKMLAFMLESPLPENMIPMMTQEYVLPLHGDVADMTFFAFVLHENADVLRLLKEAARITKSSGKIVIIDWKKEIEEHGPPMGERLDKDELKKLLQNFTFIEEGDLNASHYFFVIR